MGKVKDVDKTSTGLLLVQIKYICVTFRFLLVRPF